MLSDLISTMLTPFVLALLFSLMLEPPVAALSRLYGSRRLAAALVFGVFLSLVLLAAGLGFSHLLAETQKLFGQLILLELPESWPADLLADYGLRLLSLFSQILRATPSALVTLLVTLLATYYLCVEPELLLRFLRMLAPARWRERLDGVYQQAMLAFAAYLRAQATVLAANTLLAMLGLSLLGVDYVLLLGLICGLLDMLPVLGPGTLFLPWALLAGLSGDAGLAGGLLLLYLLMTVCRQLLEQRLVGMGLGLHPLATLSAGFAGLLLLGALGMMLGPLLASLGFFIYRESRPAA